MDAPCAPVAGHAPMFRIILPSTTTLWGFLGEAIRGVRVQLRRFVPTRASRNVQRARQINLLHCRFTLTNSRTLKLGRRCLMDQMVRKSTETRLFVLSFPLAIDRASVSLAHFFFFSSSLQVQLADRINHRRLLGISCRPVMEDGTASPLHVPSHLYVHTRYVYTA